METKSKQSSTLSLNDLGVAITNHVSGDIEEGADISVGILLRGGLCEGAVVEWEPGSVEDREKAARQKRIREMGI